MSTCTPTDNSAGQRIAKQLDIGAEVVRKVDRGHLSLEQVEGDFWPEAPGDATGLMRTVHALRRKPIGGLGPGELRVLLEQQVGVGVLLPRALAVLRQEPLGEGDYYPGDLLWTVLRLPAQYWAADPECASLLPEIAEKVRDSGELKEGFAPHDEIRIAFRTMGVSRKPAPLATPLLPSSAADTTRTTSGASAAAR